MDPQGLLHALRETSERLLRPHRRHARRSTTACRTCTCRPTARSRSSTSCRKRWPTSRGTRARRARALALDRRSGDYVIVVEDDGVGHRGADDRAGTSGRPLRHRDHARARAAPGRHRRRSTGPPARGTRLELVFPARSATRRGDRHDREPIRVVLIDDHGLCRRGLSELLEQRAGIKVVGNTGNADEAVRLLREERPDLAIMDLRMPPVDGHRLLTRIRAEGIDTPVVVLTMSDSQEDLGARVPRRRARLPAEGHGSRRRHRRDPAHGARRGGRGAGDGASSWSTCCCPAQPGTSRADYMKSLTEREREILQHLSNGKSNKAIAQALDISHDTVKLHVRHILSKLGLRVARRGRGVRGRAPRRGGVRLGASRRRITASRAAAASRRRVGAEPVRAARAAARPRRR